MAAHTGVPQTGLTASLLHHSETYVNVLAGRRNMTKFGASRNEASMKTKAADAWQLAGDVEKRSIQKLAKDGMDPRRLLLGEPGKSEMLWNDHAWHEKLL
jgi:hypothetical protein